MSTMHVTALGRKTRYRKLEMRVSGSLEYLRMNERFNASVLGLAFNDLHP